MILLGACSRGESAETSDQAIPDAASAVVAKSRTVDAGMQVVAALTDRISSHDQSVGDRFTARVVADVLDSSGSVVIPAGSMVDGTITDVSPAANTRSTGTLTLMVSSISIGGQTQDLDASIGALETVQDARGVQKEDAARVAGGAVAGGILGRVIGGDKKGTIIGAAAGAVAGAAVSAAVKDSDIVLPAGALLTLSLRTPLTVKSE
jgi:hypothetical protein